MTATRGLAGEVRAGLGKRRGGDLVRVDDGCLVVRCLRTYRFAADEVLAIERRESAWFDAGVRIVHNRADCPRSIGFRCTDGSDAVFALLARAGFVPRGAGPTAGRSSLRTVAIFVVAALALQAIVSAAFRLFR